MASNSSMNSYSIVSQEEGHLTWLADHVRRLRRALRLEGGHVAQAQGHQEKVGRPREVTAVTAAPGTRPRWPGALRSKALAEGIDLVLVRHAEESLAEGVNATPERARLLKEVRESKPATSIIPGDPP